MSQKSKGTRKNEHDGLYMTKLSPDVCVKRLLQLSGRRVVDLWKRKWVFKVETRALADGDRGFRVWPQRGWLGTRVQGVLHPQADGSTMLLLIAKSPADLFRRVPDAVLLAAIAGGVLMLLTGNPVWILLTLTLLPVSLIYSGKKIIDRQKRALMWVVESVLEAVPSGVETMHFPWLDELQR